MQHSEPVLSSSSDKLFFTKEQITMKKRKTNQFISILLAFVLLLCSVVPAYAVEGGEPDQIESQDLFITDEVAKHIALLFLEDMVNTGLTTWDESTELVRVVPMYDETGENISAYTAELTLGYIVISSYADVPNLIFEWADEAEPMYAGLPAAHNARSAAKIIYVGPVDYYLDSGSDTLTGIEGEQVPRDALSNDFDEYRDIENVSPEAIEMLTEAKQEALENGGISAQANIGPDNSDTGYIRDSVEYAKNLYGPNGRYECTAWNNKWESAATFTIMGNFLDYKLHCGLVAITNAIKMYGNQYNKANIKQATSTQVFNNVVAVNKENDEQYYKVTVDANGNVSGGTYRYNLDQFIEKSFLNYATHVDVYGPYWCNMDNIRNATTANRLMLINLHTYGLPYITSAQSPYHMVIGYAWACLTEKNTLTSMYFLKISDGHFPSARNLDVTRLPADQYWEIYFG